MENRAGRTRYALVIRVPHETGIAIEDRFLALAGISKPSMGYHITLVGPFFLGEGQDVGVFEALAVVCERAFPVGVEVNGLGVFSGRDHTVYLPVVENEDLLRLHRALLTYLRPHIVQQYDRCESDENQFLAHITLGLGLSDKELEAFCQDNGQPAFRTAFSRRAVWLAEQRPNTPWRYRDQYALGEADPQEIRSKPLQ